MRVQQIRPGERDSTASACVLPLGSHGHGPSGLSGHQREWELEATWPLHGLQPLSLPRLFCELSSQLAMTHTRRFSEVRAPVGRRTGPKTGGLRRRGTASARATRSSRATEPQRPGSGNSTANERGRATKVRAPLGSLDGTGTLSEPPPFSRNTSKLSEPTEKPTSLSRAVALLGTTQATLPLKKCTWGTPGGLSGRVPACSPGRDPRVPRSSPASGSLHGACFSLCLCLCLSLSLYVYRKIKKS